MVHKGYPVLIGTTTYLFVQVGKVGDWLENCWVKPKARLFFKSNPEKKLSFDWNLSLLEDLKKSPLDTLLIEDILGGYMIVYLFYT